jgi:hypothetical protein
MIIAAIGERTSGGSDDGSVWNAVTFSGVGAVVSAGLSSLAGVVVADGVAGDAVGVGDGVGVWIMPPPPPPSSLASLGSVGVVVGADTTIAQPSTVY